MPGLDKMISLERTRLLDDSSSSSSSYLQGATATKKPLKRTWKSYIWDTFDKSPEERAFLFKLDTALMTLASLGYFIKYLDQVNIKNAFVSGMKEDMNLVGNEWNYMQTCWTIGYVLGEIPSNMLLTRIRPSIWIPACEVTWSILTVLLARCTTANQMYVLRFFVGLAESSFYPGMQYIIGSWYRKDELAKRSCLFHAMGNFGSMMSGYLMAGSYDLDGLHGLHGWQWLFIANTVVSLPIAISGFFFLPDVPEITNVWYLTEDEIELAKKRMKLEGRANREPYTREKFRKIFSSWHIYALVSLYILFNNGNGGSSQPALPIWMKEQGYSIKEINIYPTIVEVIGIITTLIYGWTSDGLFGGARWPAIVFSGVIKIIAYVGLTIWDIPNALKWTCFLLCGFGGGISGLTFAWAHEICSGDNEERALVTATMNEMAYVFQAWLPLIIWKQVEAPSYPLGYPIMVLVAIALIANSFVIRYLQRREQRQRADELVDETSRPLMN
ncbi:major facilitator superfamily domain-containing protein [Dactylonectria macrodidyma]|uniref:Major facilitator superfamily domain-containing protein n=1 Tax=Dactylonectria macrodidyma TaxID=307937 RepID=A0A9P9JHN9_9HYPO|nr:major facilitator superfamily domain-containing protein [Dactylonectria macrodidyma]